MFEKQKNKNLEEQTDLIYSLLFIKNHDPNWSLGTLSNLISVKYGKDHKKFQDGTYPVYGSGGIMRYIDKSIYKGESVLIPRKGTLDNILYVNGAFWTVDTMFYTEMLEPNVAKYVFHYLKSIDLPSLNVGSAVPSMTTKILNTLPIYIPDSVSLERFEMIVRPMYEKINENMKQSAALSRLRDILLTYLMSRHIVLRR